MKAYAIKDPKGRILMESCQLKAYQSKSWFESYNSWVNCGWKRYYKRGYRCVPVIITEVKTEK